VRYRAPGSSDWEEKDWDWALDRITHLVKEARDTGFATQTPDGLTVNRTETIANLGGAGLNNEECYVLSKFARGLGIVNLDHQARI